ASTARIITGAALIIVAVFAGFAAGELVMFQQMGFGVAAALLIDATIIRSVVLPSAMKLLGNWNWYLPRWLDWLPRLHVEAQPRERSSIPRPLSSRVQTMLSPELSIGRTRDERKATLRRDEARKELP